MKIRQRLISVLNASSIIFSGHIPPDHLFPFMNFEKQVCKQVSEQPAYITSEPMLKMLRASFIRYDRALNESHFLPLFFSFSDSLISVSDKFFSEIAPIQKCHFQARSDAEVSQNVSGLVRTAKSLPLVIRNIPSVGSSSRSAVIPCKSTYDLVYHYFSEQEVDVVEFAERIAKLYDENFKVVRTANGAVIVDPSIKKETVIQQKCEYKEYDKNIEIPPLKEIETPNISTIEQLAEFVKQPKENLVKAVMYAVDGKLVFANIRGDLEVSEEKLRHFLGLSDSNIDVQLAPLELLEKHGLVPGFSGLVGVKSPAECTLLCDDSVNTVGVGVTGANKKDYHYIDYNVERDTKKISKFIRYADVAENPLTIEGAIVIEISDCKYFYPNMIGLDSKPKQTPLYKITFRLVDLVATTLGVSRKIQGAYIINVGKDETKLDATVKELLKYCPPECIVTDNRAKPAFGAKMQLASIMLFKYLIVCSNKLDAETVSVNDQPVKIAELGSLFEK